MNQTCIGRRYLKFRLILLVQLLISKGSITAPEYAGPIAQGRPSHVVLLRK